MSGNHYPHNPHVPPPVNMNPMNTLNKQKNDFCSPPVTSTPPWSVSQPNEFENREKYMETQLTASCDVDPNANVNEVVDDGPYPPPGLRRLVTGQTVSFDDGPVSPPFDRVVTGEGNTFSNYFQNTKPSKPDTDTHANENIAISERFVSGSTTKDFNSYQPFTPPPSSHKKDTSYASNNFYTIGAENNTYNSTSQDFFDSYLQNNNSIHEPDNAASKISQHPAKNKFSVPPSNYQNYEPDKRDYFMPEKPVNHPKIPPPVLNEGLHNRNLNSAFQNNFPKKLPTSLPSSASQDLGMSQLTAPSYQSAFHPVNHYDNSSPNMHSKSHSASSNTSSLNDPFGYQQNETYYQESTSKRNDYLYNSEIVNDSAENSGYDSQTNLHNFRSNENHHTDSKVKPSGDRTSKPNVADVHQNEPENATNEVKQFPKPAMEKSPYDYENDFPNFENIADDRSLSNEVSFIQKPSNDSIPLNQEDLHGHHDGALRKEIPYVGQERSFVEQRDIPHIGKERSFVEQRDIKRKPSIGNSEIPQNMGVPKQSPFRRNSLAENQERVDSDGVSLERGTVPGAQSTPNDDQPIARQFANSNNTYYYGVQNRVDDDDDREENAHYTDNDEKMFSRRMVLGYNSNTIPGPRQKTSKLGQNSSLNKQYPMPSYNKGNKIDPPIERRMVLGETSSDAAAGPNLNRSKEDRQYEEKSRRGGNLHPKDKDSISGGYEKSRKKQLYDRRDRRKIESDEEDFDESVGQGYDDSPDRESHNYHDKHYRTSPRRLDKRIPSRRDRESSFTQSQDESYYDDDDDDYSSYRNQRKYRERRYREPSYKPFNDSYYRKDSRHYRERRDDYYSNRYEEESFYGNTRTSRPSSRSGSEYYGSLRYRNRPKHYEHLDHRYIFHGRMPKADAEYWSEIRELDPKKYVYWFKDMFPSEYADWYARYNVGKVIQNSGTFQPDRRGSGHSGQSSVNNDTLSVNDEKLLDIGTIQEMRNTPAKFTAPHVKGLFNPLGQLIVINPCSPSDGQRADLDIYQLLPPEMDADCEEFMNFTGPFIVGETHVNTVSDFVRYHASMATSSSKELLYLLIDLIIKLRGVTDGIAISELLMDFHRKSKKSSKSHPKEEKESNYAAASETDVIEKYTSLLLQGNKNAALDCAVNNKLWGHAFLLSSKMGSKHYSKVLAKFDSSIPMNNPLKTLYQLYSDQVPQSVTACGDDKWGDWKPHLAMILSNPTSNSELDKKAIITLGDSLAHKDVYAAHFCYLAAQVDFDLPNKPSAKYTLLSLANNVNHFGVDVCNHAILLTQTYEFAKRLQKKEFTISSLLPYKYLLTTRLINYGKINVAMQYLESIALDLIENPTDTELMYNVLELSERLKYSDSKPLVAADSSTDKQWLTKLRQIVSENCTGSGFHTEQHRPKELAYSDQPYSSQPSITSPVQQLSPLGDLSQQQQQPQPPTQSQQPLFIRTAPLSSQSTQAASGPPLPPSVDTRTSPQWENGPYSQEQKHISPTDYGYNSQDQFGAAQTKPNDFSGVNEAINQQQASESYDQMGSDQQPQGYYSQWDQPQQPISISTQSKFSYFDLEDSGSRSTNNDNARVHKEDNQIRHPPNNTVENRNSSSSAPSNNKEKAIESPNNGGGWLGGIFGKLSLRPKNEMKLPDDKNKSIVWSEEKKRWVNINEPDDNNADTMKPPPKSSNFRPNDTSGLGPMNASALGPMNAPAAGPTNAFSYPADPNKPPMMNSNNVYKLSRGKGMKANYVNILSQSTTPSSASMPPNPHANSQMLSNMQLLVPSPNDGNVSSVHDQMSSNTKPTDHTLQNREPNPNMPPQFYNPAQYNNLLG